MKKILLLFILLSTICFGKTLKIGTTSYPGAEIMNLIKDDLKAKGIELEIVEMNDYVTPNLALEDGDIDVNSFQHLPYLEAALRRTWKHRSSRGRKRPSRKGI